MAASSADDRRRLPERGLAAEIDGRKSRTGDFHALGMLYDAASRGPERHPDH
jgi:hypothetical protein